MIGYKKATTPLLEKLSADELNEQIRTIKEQLSKLTMRVVRKTQIRRKKSKSYRYTYYYAQFEIVGKTFTKYLGKKVPEEFLELEKLKEELKSGYLRMKPQTVE